MKDLTQKIKCKIEEQGSKKTLENLVVFIVILIVTVVFINYIWKDDNPKDKAKSSQVLANDETEGVLTEKVEISNHNLEFEIENILKKLDGVEDVKVLITYEEYNRVVPMYNEDSQDNITTEEDNQGGKRTINESSQKKEVVYEEENGVRKVVTSTVITPKIKGAVVMAKGANNVNVKTNIIQAVQVATGLAPHKIQVFEMK